jgi:hypothetical protein
MPMRIHGSCHCGNIQFELDWLPDPIEISARACTCTFCQKHGGVWTSCPDGSLLVSIEDASRVSRYEFGTRTAQFHVCATCGAVPIVTSDIDQATYAVVNVNAFEGVDRALIKQASATFEGEDESSRLARRKQRWIANVRFAATR